MLTISSLARFSLKMGFKRFFEIMRKLHVLEDVKSVTSLKVGHFGSERRENCKESKRRIKFKCLGTMGLGKQ